MLKKNVLLITESFPFDEGEMGFLPTEFRRLTEQFQVTVLTYSPERAPLCPVPKDVAFYHIANSRLKPLLLLPAQLRHAEVRHELHGLLPGGRKTVTPRQMLDAAIFSARADCIMQQMRSIVHERDIGLIYTYWCTQATVAALRLKKELPQLKVITRFHGYDLYSERCRAGRQPLRDYIARNADSLVFACERGREYFLGCWPGEWENRCRVAYLGTEPMPPKTRLHSDRLVIVSCSNMIPLKRIERIIQALALLPDDIRAEWHHFGDGTSRPMLEEQAVQMLQNRPNISWHFEGAVPHADLAQRYAELQPDAFLTTSSTEGGAPVSVQEAMAMGMPAIGTDVGGMAELIQHGVNGYLLPADASAQQVCDAIVQFVRLPIESRHAFGKASYERWAESFNAERKAQQLVEWLAAL